MWKLFPLILHFHIIGTGIFILKLVKQDTDDDTTWGVLPDNMAVCQYLMIAVLCVTSIMWIFRIVNLHLCVWGVAEWLNKLNLAVGGDGGMMGRSFCVCFLCAFYILDLWWHQKPKWSAGRSVRPHETCAVRVCEVNWQWIVKTALWAAG